MAAVLYALEIWMLICALVAWLLCRAASRLRERPLIVADPAEAQEMGGGPGTLPAPTASRPEELIRALRVYETG